MPSEAGRYFKFGGVTLVILAALSYLAYTGVQQSKSYYVTISELHKMGDGAYSKRLRVAGNVLPGSIKRRGANVEFELAENDQLLQVAYSGTEPPPDTFKDNSQALAAGHFGRDGIFYANELQAKCASKYAPAPGAPSNGAPANGAPGSAPVKSVTQVGSSSSGMAN
jgi:cytochrome c-type biogenesis protein CcmE